MLVLRLPTVAKATWPLQSPPSPGACTDAQLQQIFGRVDVKWEIQGRTPMALVVQHGAG